MPKNCSGRMTSCEPRWRKVANLENKYEIAIELRNRSLTITDNVNTPADDELSSGSSPSLSLLPTKNARESPKAKSLKRPSHHLAFSDAISGASCRARREISMRQNQPVQALGNVSVLPKV